MERTPSAPKLSLRGNNYKIKKAKFITHARDTSTHPDLHPNQMLMERTVICLRTKGTDGRTPD